MRALIVVGLSLFATAPAACSSSSTNETTGGSGGIGNAGTGGANGGSNTGGSNTGGMAAATAGGTAGQAGISGAGGSGMTTGDSGLDSACPPKKPVDAYDVTPGGGCGVVCDPKNVLLGDGKFTGLDCVGTLPYELLAGQKVDGCVAVDFGANTNLDPLVFRMKAIGNACGGNCGAPPGDAATLCGTGDDFYVFRGDILGSYVFVGAFPFSSSLTDVYVNLKVPARYVVACRPGYGLGRDDSQIDAIWSEACP